MSGRESGMGLGVGVGPEQGGWPSRDTDTWLIFDTAGLIMSLSAADCRSRVLYGSVYSIIQNLSLCLPIYHC